MQVRAQGSSEQDAFAGALLLDQGSGLLVVAGHGFSIAELDRVLPGESGALAAALSGGEPSLSHMPADDPELGQLASLHPFPLVLSIPLRKPARDRQHGPPQTIAAIAMRLTYARRLIERDPTAAGAEIHKLEDIARQTTREIRHMLFTLRPLVLESRGLVPALGPLAAQLAETHGQQGDPGAERRAGR